MKAETIRARINTELKQNFEQLCKTKGMDTSDRLRYLIMQDIENSQQKEKAPN